ncbi:hypothetical protein NL676_039405 [Syzygium grande]|nr:hypothetical protein NL676_039405 [Syzygium grande]
MILSRRADHGPERDWPPRDWDAGGRHCAAGGGGGQNRREEEADKADNGHSNDCENRSQQNGAAQIHV